MTWLRRAVRLLPVVILFTLATSCDNFFVSPSSVESVTVSPTAVFLKSGVADTSTLSSSALTAAGPPAVNDTQKATWSSDNNNVVTAAADGVINEAAGAADDATAHIIATDGGVKSNQSVVVIYSGAAPTVLNVGSQSGAVTFAAGTQFQATASATFPGDATLSATGAMTPYVTWTPSAATTVYTISSTGLVNVVSAATPFTISGTITFGSVGAPSNTTVTGTSVSFN
jgi:hypothetical protein